jgi:hypothetical protein
MIKHARAGMPRKMWRSDPVAVPLQESIGNCYDSGVRL